MFTFKSQSSLFFVLILTLIICQLGVKCTAFCSLKYNNDHQNQSIYATAICSDKCSVTGSLKILSDNGIVKLNVGAACRNKCIHDLLDQNTADGRWSGEKVKEFEGKSNATEEYLQKVSAIVDECASLAEEKLKEFGGFQSNLCAYHEAATVCRTARQNRMRSELSKLLCEKS